MEGKCNEEDRTVEEFETPAATLLHEFLHTGVCNDIQAPFNGQRETYGAQDCYDLARDENKADEALTNADSWMLVTIGTYWDNKCERQIKRGITTEIKGPRYNPGTCSLHLTQSQACEDETYFGSVELFDDRKKKIGGTPAFPPSGKIMTAEEPYHMTSQLKNVLTIAGQQWDDYVQFSIGGLSWRSDEPNDGAECAVGGWTEGNCESGELIEWKTRDMDCSFPCDGNL